MTDDAIAELTPILGSVRAACKVAGRAQASHYRRHRQSPKPDRPAVQRRPQPRALSQAERDSVRAVLNGPAFVDMAPASVYHELLGEGVYLCSVSSMYRILRSHQEVRERRRQAVHPARVKPELVATQANQCWSWDITKLHGPAKWTYYQLYVILDIYSRYVVGWLIADVESAALAEKLLADTITKQNINRAQLTIHADNGASMASKPVASLLADDRTAFYGHRPYAHLRAEFEHRLQQLQHAAPCAAQRLRLATAKPWRSECECGPPVKRGMPGPTSARRDPTRRQLRYQDPRPRSRCPGDAIARERQRTFRRSRNYVSAVTRSSSTTRHLICWLSGRYSGALCTSARSDG
jgi:transposase InsO family protein